MQDEVAKHTRKIYETVQKPNQGFWEKFKEVLIEIFIIVFAVTLSIWLHNWSDHRHEQSETREFLRGLKDDLTKDIRLMSENTQTFQKVDTEFHYLITLDKSHAIDTVDEHRIYGKLDFEMLGTHANIGRYEGFKSSGKIGAIEDDSLKQSILVYYQQTIPNIVDIETIANSFQTRVMEMELGKDDKQSIRDLVKTFRMQAMLQMGTQNLEGAIRAYDAAKAEAQHIIALIDHN